MEDFLKRLASKIRGPGGAIAVVRDGELVAKHVYGYADLDRRIPITSKVQFPICSISKQMTCLVMADLAQRPTPRMVEKGGDVYEQLTAELKEMLPQLIGHKDGDLQLEHLYNMQSGIRDYWAMTTLWGARPDDPFSILNDAPAALERTKSFHFKPGSEHSYSNVNFHILGKLLERVSGQSLGQLLAQRVFAPAGMTTAALYPYTAGHPLPIVGYEFTEQLGFIPAVNRIEWAGDAGNVASLEDMIAYEKYLHRSYADPNSIYHTISRPQTYASGAPSPYGFGLVQTENPDLGLQIGHGGALRGFRLGRAHFPAAKLSVVVLMNHESNPLAPIEAIAREALGVPAAPVAEPLTVGPEWLGWFLEEDTGLLVHVTKAVGAEGKVDVTYEPHGDTLTLIKPRAAGAPGVVAEVEGEWLEINRVHDNRKIRARRIAGDDAVDGNRIPAKEGFAGVYHCEEVQSTFHVTGQCGMLYGAFDGFFRRQGPIWLMKYIGEDVWILGNPRGLDAAAPGDWTCIFERAEDGKVTGVTVGCWLARKVQYTRIA